MTHEIDCIHKEYKIHKDSSSSGYYPFGERDPIDYFEASNEKEPKARFTTTYYLQIQYLNRHWEKEHSKMAHLCTENTMANCSYQSNENGIRSFEIENKKKGKEYIMSSDNILACPDCFDIQDDISTI